MVGSISNSVTFVIPVLNEVNTLGGLVDALIEMDSNADILVVDDGSIDGSAELALEKGVQVVRHTQNLGNGAAVKTGLRNAKNQFVVIVDGDGQHSIDEIRSICSLPTSMDLVVGVRSFRWSRFRDFGNLFLSKIASILTGVKIPDLTSGLRRINRKKALSFIDIYPQGFSFPSTSTILFITSFFSVHFVPIKNRPRPSHASKSKLHPIRDGVKFMGIVYRLVMLSYPLKFFIPIGFFFVNMGFIWVTRTLLLSAQVSAAGVLFLLSGLIFILFGSIADQLAQIRRLIASRKTE